MSLVGASTISPVGDWLQAFTLTWKRSGSVLWVWTVSKVLCSFSERTILIGLTVNELARAVPLAPTSAISAAADRPGRPPPRRTGDRAIPRRAVGSGVPVAGRSCIDVYTSGKTAGPPTDFRN